MKTKFLITAVGLSALAFAGCESAPTNTTVKVNSNTAVVVNSNTNAVVVTNTTTNSNRWANSNISRADYDKSRADYEKDKGTSTIGQGANDSWIWFKTKTALATTADLRDSTINVDVVNDVITLKGTVETAEQKAKADMVAKGIEGQKGVKNELKVAKNDSMTNQMVNGGSTPAANANMKK